MFLTNFLNLDLILLCKNNSITIDYVSSIHESLYGDSRRANAL